VRPGNGARLGLLGPTAAGLAQLGATGAQPARVLERRQRMGVCLRPVHGAVGGGSLATES
jgi:hypothetical protein